MNKKILTVTLNPAIDYSVSVNDFKIDHVNRGEAGRRDPGGKGINTATVTSRLGITTTVTGFLGNRNRSIFNEHFEYCSIKDQLIYIDGTTREGIKISDRTQNLTTDINFPGFKVDRQALEAFLARFEKLFFDYDYILMSGSLPEGLPADIYNRLTAIVLLKFQLPSVPVTASSAGLLQDIFLGRIIPGHCGWPQPPRHQA